jgi:predicted flap endonuclease-1-like 5' DNA nuclease
MFQEWGFLITEMVMLIILAALLGLIVGWVIWGRAGGSAKAEAELAACREGTTAKDTRITTLESELEAARGEALAAEKAAMLAAEEAVPAAEAAAAQAHAEDDAKLHAVEAERDAARAEALAAEKAAMLAAGEAAAVAEAVEADHGAHPMHPGEDYDGDGKLEGTDEGTKPATLDAPRDAGADDLKQIKGIGPKLEQLCHALGFYHFDQIAAWSADEIAWVDANLQGFKGRVSRDNWVAQAKTLAAGGTTEFAARVKDGKVYE